MKSDKTDPFVDVKLTGKSYNPDWINKDEIVVDCVDRANAIIGYIDIFNRRTNKIKRLYDKTMSEQPSMSFDKKSVAFLCGNQREFDEKFKFDLCVSPVIGDGLKRYQLLLERYRPAWFPNGYELALTGGDDTVTGDEYIYIYNTKTKNITRVVEGVAPAISPDGKYMAYLKLRRTSTKADLMLLELSSRKEVVLVSNEPLKGSSSNSPRWTPDGSHILYTRYAAILLPPEKHTLEAYSLEKHTTTSIFQVSNKVVGFSCR